MWWRWAPPDPGTGAGIELVRGKTRGDGHVLVMGEVLARAGGTPNEAPPACDQVEPGGAHWDGDWGHPRVCGKPVLEGQTAVTREVIGDQIPVSGRVGLRYGREPGSRAGGSARACRLGEDLPVLDPKRAVDPELVGAAPRPYSRGALLRCPSADQPGAGGNARGVTGPTSSRQRTVAPAGGSV